MWLELEDSNTGVYQSGLPQEPCFQTLQGAGDSTELFSGFQVSLSRGNQLIAAVCDGLIAECIFLILLANQREGNPQSPGVHMNRKHHQVTKTPQRSAETQGAVGNSTPDLSVELNGQWGVGEDNQPNSTPK